MATVQTLPPPPPPIASPHAAEMLRPPELETERGLVPTAHLPVEAKGITLTPAIARLPVELDVSIPVRGFRVRNLLALEPGSVIETQWGHGEDMLLAAGAVQLAWSEFEVVETALAVRVTRLV